MYVCETHFPEVDQAMAKLLPQKTWPINYSSHQQTVHEKKKKPIFFYRAGRHISV